MDLILLFWAGGLGMLGGTPWIWVAGFLVVRHPTNQPRFWIDAVAAVVVCTLLTYILALMMDFPPPLLELVVLTTGAVTIMVLPLLAIRAAWGWPRREAEERYDAA